jgi:hypothetical protein
MSTLMSRPRAIFVLGKPVRRNEIFRRISDHNGETVTTTVTDETIFIELHGILSRVSLARPVKRKSLLKTIIVRPCVREVSLESRLI